MSSIRTVNTVVMYIYAVFSVHIYKDISMQKSVYDTDCLHIAQYSPCHSQYTVHKA